MSELANIIGQCASILQNIKSSADCIAIESGETDFTKAIKSDVSKLRNILNGYYSNSQECKEIRIKDAEELKKILG